jgi:hypothetical protein
VLLMNRLVVVAFGALVLLGSWVAEGDAAVRITELMSEGQGDTDQGNGGRRQREFFEITNLGAAAVDVSTWSYNDNNTNDPHNFGPQIGSIAAGESVVFTQMTADNFRRYWGLPASVRVFSYLQLSNLGNADTVNIYNSFTQDATTLVDSLTYTADARGSGISRNRPWDGGQGQFDNSQWVVSNVGDSFGSFLAPNATGFPPNYPNAIDYTDLANPGRYANVPEPGLVVMLVMALGMLPVRRVRRR